MDGGTDLPSNMRRIEQKTASHCFPDTAVPESNTMGIEDIVRQKVSQYSNWIDILAIVAEWKSSFQIAQGTRCYESAVTCLLLMNISLLWIPVYGIHFGYLVHDRAGGGTCGMQGL